jgi:uncharacterized protein (TIGR02147 family)
MLRGGRPARRKTLSREVFDAIAEPHHYYILTLMQTAGFRSDPEWIADRLGLPLSKTREALERLIRIGLLRRGRGGVLFGITDGLTTSDLPSAALRASHAQTLREAIEVLETVPRELRTITSSTVALDPAKLPQAVKLIRNFRRGLCELLQDGERLEVYNLNVQLVPVTKFTKTDGGGPV